MFDRCEWAAALAVDRRPRPSARTVGETLIDLFDDSGRCQRRVVDLAEAAGLTVGATHNGLKRLENYGLIRSERTTPRTYEATLPLATPRVTPAPGAELEAALADRPLQKLHDLFVGVTRTIARKSGKTPRTILDEGFACEASDEAWWAAEEARLGLAR